MEEFYNIAGNKVTKSSNRVAKKRVSLYGLLIRDGQLLLVLPHYFEKWEIPGGGVDKNEDELLALKREFFEETGYIITKVGKCITVQESNFYADDIDEYSYSTQKFYLIKRAKRVEKNIARIDNKEIKQIKWFSPKEAKTVIRDNEKKIIDSLYKSQTRVSRQ